MLLISWLHIEVTHNLFGLNGIDEGVLIDFLDLGNKLSGVGGADDGVNDLLVLVGKRALAVDKGGAVSAGRVDHGADSVGHVGYDEEIAAFILIHPDGKHGGTLYKNNACAVLEVVGNIYDNPELLNKDKR